jgi:hypothetical protein
MGIEFRSQEENARRPLDMLTASGEAFILKAIS